MKKRDFGLNPIISWFCQNNLKFPLLTTILELNHLSTEKMVKFVNQYWWGNIVKATKKHRSCSVSWSQLREAYLDCLGTFWFTQWAIWSLAGGFQTVTLSCGYKNILIMVCLFSHWTEAFPCKRVTVSLVAPFRKDHSHWGTALQLHSDGGSHFTGQVLYQLCNISILSLQDWLNIQMKLSRPCWLK